MATMRELTLDTTRGPRRHTILLAAFNYLPPEGRRLDEAKRREEGELADILAGIGRDLKKDGKTVAVVLKDADDEGVLKKDMKVQLEQHHIELLRARIDEYPFWLPSASSAVADARAWLGTGAEVDTKKK